MKQVLSLCVLVLVPLGAWAADPSRPNIIYLMSEEVRLEGNNGGSTGKTWSHSVIHQAALDFIREHGSEPFFAYLPYTPPHGNFDIPDSDPAWQLYRDKPWPEPARRYAAMVTVVDRQMGEIVALLTELGIEENTVIFFSGDNGAADYFASKEFPRGVHSGNRDPRTGNEYRGRKGQLYEGGLRVPFVIRWPGTVPAGKVSDGLISQIDLYATVAAIVGAEIPDGSAEDSYNQLALWNGSGMTARRTLQSPGRSCPENKSLCRAARESC